MLRQQVAAVRSPLVRAREATWGQLPAWIRPFVWFALALLALVIPPFSDPTWMRMLFLVGLYTTLGLGLNVVVGMAGLLDLGFVAFFATGAYTVAILGSPASPRFDGMTNYWLLLPLAVGVGAGVGVLLGLPVLPLRGDYLAIVTLGFGEIIRICAVNMNDWTNGSSGLFDIVKPELGFRTIDDVKGFYALVLVAALVVWFVTSRLRDSGVGRAWEAIREDEDVAAGMGINTTRYKLMAFSVGAACGALGGAIYAPFIDFVAPQSFTLIVSINVIALVIIGGMGSTQGVVVGALILIGVPELLQFRETEQFLSHMGWLRSTLNGGIDGLNWLTHLDLSQLPPAEKWGEELALYRFVVYGLLLVLVMVLRPGGLFPAKRRSLVFETPREVEKASAVTPKEGR